MNSYAVNDKSLLALLGVIAFTALTYVHFMATVYYGAAFIINIFKGYFDTRTIFTLLIAVVCFLITLACRKGGKSALVKLQKYRLSD
jgi:general stress protein CsbA